MKQLSIYGFFVLLCVVALSGCGVTTPTEQPSAEESDGAALDSVAVMLRDALSDPIALAYFDEKLVRQNSFTEVPKAALHSKATKTMLTDTLVRRGVSRVDATEHVSASLEAVPNSFLILLNSKELTATPDIAALPYNQEIEAVKIYLHGGGIKQLSIDDGPDRLTLALHEGVERPTDVLSTTGVTEAEVGSCTDSLNGVERNFPADLYLRLEPKPFRSDRATDIAQVQATPGWIVWEYTPLKVEGFGSKGATASLIQKGGAWITEKQYEEMMEFAFKFAAELDGGVDLDTELKNENSTLKEFLKLTREHETYQINGWVKAQSAFMKPFYKGSELKASATVTLMCVSDTLTDEDSTGSRLGDIIEKHTGVRPTFPAPTPTVPAPTSSNLTCTEEGEYVSCSIAYMATPITTTWSVSGGTLLYGGSKDAYIECGSGSYVDVRATVAYGGKTTTLYKSASCSSGMY